MIRATPFIGEMVLNFGDPEAQMTLIDILFVPFLWAFFHTIKVLFSTYFGALSDQIGRKSVINMGWSIYALVYLGFAFLDNIPNELQVIITFILFAVYAFYHASCEGTEKAIIADLVKPELHGSAYGLFNFSTGLASLPASIVFGFVYIHYGAWAAFGTGVFIAFISMMLFVMFVKESR